ncbi:hypothetical protein KPL71_013426 [Citrus sinensis]|uniref:Uncharacterized protein n=1 Tax=Citrus sinensis TaxID=2711 RepID=A0ACB8LK03_CITSI|nr:hypothetical protein KPL71_013426 [Citrus sinensis]
MAYYQKKKRHGIIAIFLLVACLFEAMDHTVAVWLNHGGDLNNRRYAYGEVLINPVTVRNLRLRWSFYAGKDISATPAVANGVVYFPSWNGYLYAVNAFNGALIWEQNLSKLTGLSGTGIVVNVTVSRSTPTIAGDLLIVGIYGPAVVVVVSRSNGRLVWSTQLDPRPRSQITMSGSFYMGAFYVGLSSLEEALPADQCCTFRGSLAKLDVRTGRIICQTYMLPDNGGKREGYSGAAVWGSSPAIDVIRRRVYIGTGNLYTAPAEVLQCQEKQNNQTTKPTHPDQCISSDIYANSIVALDIDSGRIAWAKPLGGYDIFYFTCLVPNNPDCPPGPNLDADFGEAPMLLTISTNGRFRDVVVAVQKSGFAWGLDRDSGDINWFKLAGPGGREGGGVWGAATDRRRVYTNIVNNDRVNFTLAPSHQTTTAGAWVALDANSGEIIWSTADPSNETAHGPVTVVNGVLFAGSVSANGPIYAMDTNTGKFCGRVPASYGCIYLGNGYTVSLGKFHPTWTPGTSLYAFCTI